MSTGARAGASASWRVVLGVVVIAAFAFLPTLQNGFVSWDDDKNFLANPDYRGLGWTQLRWMWTTVLLGHYVPLSWMTLGLDYRIWGMNPAGYHLTGLLFHLANTVIVYLIARRLLRLGGAIPVDSGTPGLEIAAVFAALLFAVHPLRVESVAWATERRDVLSGLFFFSAVLAYLRSREASPARRWYWLTLALYPCALLSKATAITLPAVLLLLNVYPLRRLGGTAGWWNASTRRLYASMIPFLLLAFAATVMTFKALQPVPQLAIPGKIAVSAYSLIFYLWKTIAPTSLSPLYAMPPRVDPGAAKFVASYFLVIALGGVACWGAARRRWPAATTALAAFVIITFPMLGVHQNGPQIAADRYTYHAAPALAILAGAALFLLGRRHRRAAQSVAAVILVALGTLTWKQTYVWRDSRALWSHALRLDSQSPIAQNNWGNLLMQQDSVDEAIPHYERALTLASGYAQAHNGLGIALARRGRQAEAVEHFRLALASEPEYDEPRSNWGATLARQGDLSQAIEYYRQALAINPNSADAHVNWGNALVRLGKPTEAIDHYREALRIRPDHADAHHNWGVALARRGELALAIEEFRRALAINPNHAEAREYLALALKLNARRQ